MKWIFCDNYVKIDGWISTYVNYIYVDHLITKFIINVGDVIRVLLANKFVITIAFATNNENIVIYVHNYCINNYNIALKFLRGINNMKFIHSTNKISKNR